MIVIIGGGPAGRIASIHLADAGREVLLVEGGGIGGQCLHFGCMVVCALNEAARAIDDKRRVVDALQLTRDAHAVAREMVERLLRLRRDTIERHMTNVFQMVTNKKQEYDRIELAEDFAPCIVTHSGQMMKRNELSAGET